MKNILFRCDSSSTICLEQKDIKSVRLGYGLHPKYLNDVLGKKAKKDYKLGDRVEEFVGSKKIF